MPEIHYGEGLENREGRMRYPFTGIPTFLRSQLCTDISQLDADIAVMGVPTDEGSPFLPGSRFGPRGIREHSLRFPSTQGIYDHRQGRRFLDYEVTNRRIADVGDADIWPTNVKDT